MLLISVRINHQLQGASRDTMRRHTCSIQCNTLHLSHSGVEKHSCNLITLLNTRVWRKILDETFKMGQKSCCCFLTSRTTASDISVASPRARKTQVYTTRCRGSEPGEFSLVLKNTEITKLKFDFGEGHCLFIKAAMLLV